MVSSGYNKVWDVLLDSAQSEKIYEATLLKSSTKYNHQYHIDML